MSSCEGKIIDVEVELRVSGVILTAGFPSLIVVVQGSPPWNVELQIVGPQSSEILTFSNITSNRKKLEIPIPTAVDQKGGTFEIDLGQ